MDGGEHEFEAEGSEKAVKEQFEQFKNLIDGSKFAATSTVHSPAAASSAKPLPKSTDSRLHFLLENDEHKKLVSLRRKPVGEHSARDAVLLVLLGFRLIRQENEVLVTVLRDALEQSGFKVQRVDRFAIPCTKEQLVMMGGKGKGSRYALTNPGLGKAQEVMEELLKQVA